MVAVGHQLAPRPKGEGTSCTSCLWTAPSLATNVSTSFVWIVHIANGANLGVICLEEFVKGSLVARMSCLCTFHSRTYWLTESTWLIICTSLPLFVASARSSLPGSCTGYIDFLLSSAPCPSLSLSYITGAKSNDSIIREHVRVRIG